jgi:hypothetical protein
MWEDSVKVDLQQIGWGDGDWINLAQYRDKWKPFMSKVMKLQIP